MAHVAVLLRVRRGEYDCRRVQVRRVCEGDERRYMCLNFVSQIDEFEERPFSLVEGRSASGAAVPEGLDAT